MNNTDIMGRPIPNPTKRGESKAEPDTPMEDFWPPLRFTPQVARAYKRAENEGVIRIEKILISKQTQTATVRYMSAIPVPLWTREMLKEYKESEK